MDKPIEKKFINSKEFYFGIGIIGLLLLIGTSIYFSNGNSKMTVESERINIFEVKEDSFQEFIPINGTVLPISSIYLDASVGGRVEEKYVEDGAHLKKGDPIAFSLYNLLLRLYTRSASL